MTLDEAKLACENGSKVIFNGAEYIPSAIISKPHENRWFKGWYNSLRLVPCNGASSVTEARVKDCTLVEGGSG